MCKTFRPSISLLLLLAVFFFSCQPKEKKAVKNSPITETIPEEEVIQTEIRKKCIAHNLNSENDSEQLFYFAVKTYCKSWDLPLIKLYTQTEVAYIVKNGVDTLAIIPKACVPQEWQTGIILLTPNNKPEFIPFVDEYQNYQVSKADDYFGFSQSERKVVLKNMTEEDYETAYKDRLKEVDSHYKIQSKIDLMKERYVDYSEITNMSNKAFLECYLSLKYFLKKDEFDFIAYTLIHYPLEVINDEKVIHYKSAKEVEANQDQIFNQRILKIIDDANFLMMQNEGNSLYLGEGSVWFSQSGDRVKITKIKIQ